MKKLYLSILYVIMISVFIGGTVLFCKTKVRYNKAAYSPGVNGIVSGARTRAINHEDAVTSQSKNINKNLEAVYVSNGAKFNIHGNLTENKYGTVSLNFGYDINGKPVSEIIDGDRISELRGIFRLRQKYQNGYVIKNILLNETLKKLYFTAEGKPENKLFRTTLYSYDLVHKRIEKIFHDVGIFSSFSVSSDGKYNACSYMSCPQNIPNNERNTVIIFDCSYDKPVFNSSRLLTQDGVNSLNEYYIYSYYFVKWCDKNTCELSEEKRSKDGVENSIKRTLLFNLSTHKIIE